MNPWQLYDQLIDGINENIKVKSCNTGYNWTSVITDEPGMGLAMTIPVFTLPWSLQQQIAGMSLKSLALLAKSWNFIEAAIGVAAIGAYYNHPARALSCGVVHPQSTGDKQDAFALYQQEITGKKVAIIGHFPSLEQRLGGICDMSILERNPQFGDYPDSACEYILAEQDYVFITGCTLVNKTMPRLLALSANARIILVGPSIILSPVMFEYGVYGLSGLIVEDIPRCKNVLSEGNSVALFEVANMVNYIRPSNYINQAK